MGMFVYDEEERQREDCSMFMSREDDYNKDNDRSMFMGSEFWEGYSDNEVEYGD